jgi:hypothetical protein
MAVPITQVQRHKSPSTNMLQHIRRTLRFVPVIQVQRRKVLSGTNICRVGKM